MVSKARGRMAIIALFATGKSRHDLSFFPWGSRPYTRERHH